MGKNHASQYANFGSLLKYLNIENKHFLLIQTVYGKDYTYYFD